MSIKILTKNSIDNTNIDGARQNHFSAGMRSGIVKGAFNEGRFFATASNIIALDTCELRISGHQVIIDSLEAITLSDRPSTPTKYSMIAEIQVSDMSVPSFRLFIQPASVGLRQENLFKTNNGSGTYQLRIGNFTLGTTGLITDVIRTADIITGGGDGSGVDIKFNTTATQLSSSSQPTANIDYNEETKEYDAHFGIPAGSGTDVTIGGIAQKEWSADFVENEKDISGENNFNPIIHKNDAPVVFAESERQKSKNLLVYPYANTTKTNNGITFTDNGDGSITINGTNNGSGNSNFFFTSTTEFKLPAGKYTLGNFVSTNNNVNIVLYDGTLYNQVSANSSKTLTYSNDVTCYIYIGINKGTTDTFNNVVVKPMLVSGTELGEYQPYNGAIVHEKEAEKYDIVYDEKVRQTPLGGTLAYTKGLYGTVEMDLSKYRFIRAYYGHNNKQYTMIIHCDIGKNGSGLLLAEDTNILATLVSCTTTSFTLVKSGYYVVPAMTFTDRTNDAESGDGYYGVYRIEGVY